jgi:hypothetical protein
MTVNVKYQLSTAGQRAALIAGRPATSTVTEDLELVSPDQLAICEISGDGKPYLYLESSFVNGFFFGSPSFDAPPASLQEVIDTWTAHRARIDAEIAAAAAERKAREDAARLEAEQKAAHDAPLVEALLAELEQLDPLAPLPVEFANLSFSHYSKSASQLERWKAIEAVRAKAASAAAAAEKQAKEAARAAKIAEHGGHWWEPVASFCDFRGYELWSGGQTRRWVGTFSAAKGIDKFLNNPRGEFTWDTSQLERGACVQGGGFDTSSRGRRRNESEWFGVVVRNDEGGLVIAIERTRAAALQASSKLR